MEKQRYKGILYIICSAFLLALMNMFVRQQATCRLYRKAFFVTGRICICSNHIKEERYTVPV